MFLCLSGSTHRAYRRLQYNLEKIKTKAVKAIVDRLPFIQDPLKIADLATDVFDDQTPQVDCGLRKALIRQLYVRLSSILSDESAWKEYTGNKLVLKALHAHVAHLHMPDQPVAATSTNQRPSPPATPMRAKRQRL